MVATKTKKVSANVNDPVGDLLTRIRNANIAYKDDTLAPVSKQARALLSILTEEGYIAGFEQEGEGVHQAFKIIMKYGPRKAQTITGIKRVSKPGRRLYKGRGELPRVMGGLGIAIVSTSQGLMTDRNAAKKRVGGEILAYVW
ncbi:MAG: 30S ribosomal protein S8 [Actinomycetota bacterium]